MFDRQQERKNKRLGLHCIRLYTCLLFRYKWCVEWRECHTQKKCAWLLNLASKLTLDSASLTTVQFTIKDMF